MGRRKKGQPVHGWINLDKPQGLTSTQALARVRRFFDANKGGHAGTLDPLATGILPIALGEATKIIPFVQDSDKTYSFTVLWGSSTDTEDSEGQITTTTDIRPTEKDIQSILQHFIGEIEQIPPRYSAIKIDGQRAYDLARAGEEIEMKSRIVYIDNLELIEAKTDEACFRVYCGKGTYVRALARDIALELGTLGHITALRRESVGGFDLKNAISLDLLEKMDHSAALEKVLQPIQTPLDDIPALELSDQEVARLKNGQSLSFISKADFLRLPEQHMGTVLTMQGDKAIALTERQGAELKPVRVFNL
jgi:tRNA pseudouridine55 synthase